MRSCHLDAQSKIRMQSCDRLAIRWTRSSYKNISVADRRSVALLDSFVGPKN